MKTQVITILPENDSLRKTLEITKCYITQNMGVCSKDLRLNTSTNGLKQVYTSPQAIYLKKHIIEYVYLKII
jgi:hypothetical protein